MEHFKPTNNQVETVSDDMIARFLKTVKNPNNWPEKEIKQFIIENRKSMAEMGKLIADEEPKLFIGSDGIARSEKLDAQSIKEMNENFKNSQ